MKSILMSIQPIWVKKIISGEKTIEVRKTAPKEVPFKVYIYCTYGRGKGESALYFDAYGNVSRKANGVKWINGKVIGEFICDKVDTISVHNETVYSVNNLFADKLKNMCLTVAELKEYLGAKNNGYAIGITAPVLYDEPKELESFNYPYERYCEKGLCGNCIYEEPMGEYREVNYGCTGSQLHTHRKVICG